MDSLGSRLKRAREKANKTQGEVCKLLGISIGTLSGYERDYRNPDPQMLAKLADLYDVTTDFLLGRTDDPHGYAASNAADNIPPDIPSEKAEFLRWAEENLEDVFFYEFDKSPDEQKAEFLETVWLAWQIQKRRMERQKKKGDEG
jgi:transcriptional regulator with XRE-family HTH domain